MEPKINDMSTRVTEGALAIGAVIEGAVLPEPVWVVLVEKVGNRVRVGGEGLQTRRYHQLLLDREQPAEVRVAPAEGLYEGNPFHFKLSIEAQRLALAYRTQSVRVRCARW